MKKIRLWSFVPMLQVWHVIAPSSGGKKDEQKDEQNGGNEKIMISKITYALIGLVLAALVFAVPGSAHVILDPRITSLDPPSASICDGQFTLTVNVDDIYRPLIDHKPIIRINGVEQITSVHGAIFPLGEYSYLTATITSPVSPDSVTVDVKYWDILHQTWKYTNGVQLQFTSGDCPVPPVCQDIIGTWTFTYTYQGTDFIHTMIIDTYDSTTGAFTGHGYYNADPSITWTMTGTVTGSNVAFIITYTGGSYVVTGTGSFNGCQFMGGAATATGQGEADWIAVPTPPAPPEQLSAPPAPFTRGLKEYAYTCDQALANVVPTQELRLPAGGATLEFDVDRAAGSMDAFIVWDPQAGEQSFRPDCTGMEWWNDHCTESRRYGFAPLSIEVVNPHGKIRALAVMGYSTTPGAPPMTITIKNRYTNEVYYTETTSSEIFDKTFVVVDDFTGCVVKPQLVGNWGSWIPALPPTPAPTT